jgi:hypothetical protein
MAEPMASRVADVVLQAVAAAEMAGRALMTDDVRESALQHFSEPLAARILAAAVPAVLPLLGPEADAGPKAGALIEAVCRPVGDEIAGLLSVCAWLAIEAAEASGRSLAEVLGRMVDEEKESTNG